MNERTMMINICLSLMLTAVFFPMLSGNAAAAKSWHSWDTDTDFDSGTFTNTVRRAAGAPAFVELDGAASWDTIDYDLTKSGRMWSAAAFDISDDAASNGVMVVFGGYSTEYFRKNNTRPLPYFLGDTLEFDPDTRTWNDTTPATGGPTYRYGHSMVYNSKYDRVLMFGGYGFTGIGNDYLNDLWEYNANTNVWVQRIPNGDPSSPDARYYFGLSYDIANDKMILYGGLRGTFIYGDTWEYNYSANTWTVTSPAGPGWREWPAMTFDSKNNVTIMYGGADQTGTGLRDTWEYNATADTWILLTNGPNNPRIGTAMVFDDKLNQTVLFGGGDHFAPMAETWTYNRTSNAWSNKGDSPTSRAFHCMVYSNTTSETLVYGGALSTYFYYSNTFNDVYSYDSGSNAWTDVFPYVNTPSPTYGSSMTFDIPSGKALMFGGYTTKGWSNRTWTYDTSTDTWSLQPISTPAPSPRFGHSIAYFPDIGQNIMIGGYNGDSGGVGFASDYWFYNLTTNAWTSKGSAPPAGRVYSKMVYAEANNTVVLFGGLRNIGPAQFIPVYYGDTWIYNVTFGTWNFTTNFDKDFVFPSPRYGHVMAYDSLNGLVILFGGYSQSGFKNDTWTYYPKTHQWEQVTPSGSPSPRMGGSMVFDSARGQCVMFGGENSTSLFAQTWLYEYSPSGGKWSAGPPPPAQWSFGINHAMAYDGNNRVSVLFGGSIVNYVWGGTFELNHAYVPSGTYETATFDAGNPVANWGNIVWTGQEPANTDISFQIASNNDGVTWVYEGPYDAASGTPLPISATHNGNRYIRIRVSLDTSDLSLSPRLNDVNITYNMAPGDPVMMSPIGSAIVFSSTPRFNWTFNDPDSGDIQDAFQVLVDDDPMLASPICDSGIKASSTDYWVYTACPVLADGTYYWSVRTRDEDGIWSNYPTSQEFIVNTTPSDLSIGSPNYTSGPTTFFSSATPFTLTATGSAFSKFSIWDSTGGWTPVTTYSIPFTISGSDGTRYVSYYSTDMFGNNEAVRNYSAISGLYLDNTPPTTTLAVGSPEKVDGGNTYFNSSTLFTIASNDGSGSGSNPWYRVWKAGTGWSNWTLYTGPFTISGADGIRYIQYNGTDNVGNAEAVHNYSSISQLVLDTTSPRITLTNPGHNAINVPTTQDVVITFSEKMNKSSFKFQSTPDPGGWNWLWSAGDTVATGTHFAFAMATPYVFNVTDAKDLIGNSLTSGLIPNPWTVTTIPPAISPTIVSTTPSNNQQNVPLGQSVVIEFNKQIDKSSFDYTVSPNPLGWTKVWSNGDTKVTMTHNSFDIDTEYTFTVISADDMSGNLLVGGAVPNPWTWRTVGPSSPPQIVETTPANAKEIVGLDQDVIIRFNKEMNPSTLIYTCTPDPGGWNWVWSSGNTTATGTHDIFGLFTTYVFEVTAAEDSLGNPMIGSTLNPWFWITTPDPISPYIVSTSPLNSETGVRVDSDIVITFSEPINKSRFESAIAPDPGNLQLTWQSSDTVVVLSHDDFDYSTVYAFHVTDAFDLTGNELKPSQTAENPWYWTTDDAPVTTGTITGRILDEGSLILVGAVVKLVNSSGTAVAAVLTNATGHFTFRDIPFGDYNISVSLEGYVKNDTANATISSNTQSYDVGDIVLSVLPHLDKGRIRGTVLDSEGRAVMNANVTLLDSRGEPAGWATTDSNGNYTIDNVTFGTYRLRISHFDYETFTSGYFTLDEDNPNFNTMNTLATEAPVVEEGFIPEWLWWIILIILIVVIICLAAALGMSRRRRATAPLTYAGAKKPPIEEAEEEAEEGEEEAESEEYDEEGGETEEGVEEGEEEAESGEYEEEAEEGTGEGEEETESEEYEEEGEMEEAGEPEEEESLEEAEAPEEEADVEGAVPTSCSNCGKPLEPKYKLCPFCGTPREET